MKVISRIFWACHSHHHHAATYGMWIIQTDGQRFGRSSTSAAASTPGVLADRQIFYVVWFIHGFYRILYYRSSVLQQTTLFRVFDFIHCCYCECHRKVFVCLWSFTAHPRPLLASPLQTDGSRTRFTCRQKQRSTTKKLKRSRKLRFRTFFDEKGEEDTSKLFVLLPIVQRGLRFGYLFA